VGRTHPDRRPQRGCETFGQNGVRRGARREEPPGGTRLLSDPLLYGIFAVVVTVLLAIDLLVVHKDSHAVSIKEAGIWSSIWIGCAILFGLFLTRFHEGDGGNVVLEYFTGYVIEKSLSVDNVFLFVLIFGALSVPRELQHRVLFYGVLGAIVMRTVLIFTGAALIERFDWILYIFGAFLIYTGVKTWTQRNQHPDVTESKLLKRVNRVLPTTDGYRGDHFWVRENGRLLATPMFVVLILVEFTDLVFAMDSIPAIFAITRDPFIVLTSNIFAILGLRALYFLLAGVADKLRYLKAGLAVILGFVGVKLVIESLEQDGIESLAGVPLPHIDPLASLGVIVGILAVVVVASLRAGPPDRPGEVPAGVGPVPGREKDV
jgi:tellurite resistance protein TerC